jgi:hypothetical protein
VRIEVEQGAADGTPFPATAPEALAAVKAVSSAAPAGQTRDSTPNPSVKSRGLFGSGSKEAAALTDSKEQAALKPSGGSKPAMKPVPTPAKPAAAAPAAPPPPKRDTKISASAPPEGDSDDIAAMLLGMDDDEEVPGGSTVMEAPALFTPPPAGTASKPEDKTPKKATSREDMTNAAADLLRKMARRPK